MGIITQKLNQYNSAAALNELTAKFNRRLSKENKVHPNQVEAAINCLKDFDSGLPRPNYDVLRGYCQGGKTGTMQAIILLIGELNISEVMGINKYFYITGDNTTGLKSQSEQRIDECSSAVVGDFHYLKNSDMKNDIANKDILRNAIIFADESHYGTTDEANIAIQWLRSKGLGMDNNIDLVERNIYIVSVSATIYKEFLSDEKMWKNYITLETGEGYRGFKDFYAEKCFQPVRSAITRNNAEDRFFEMRNYLDDIKQRTGREKCAIVRVSSGKAYSRYRDIAEKYFRVMVIDGSEGKIDYNAIENILEHRCDGYEKPLLIIIKGAFRMGISLHEYAKKNIGVVFDYSDGNNVIATEQGLLGRVSGYWTTDDWKDLKIYINANQYETLIDYYINENIPHPLMKKVNNVFVEDENGTELGFADLGEPFTIPCTEKYDGNEYNELVKNYVIDYFNKQGTPLRDDVVWLAGRRWKDGKGHKYAHFDMKEHSTKSILDNHPEYIGMDFITAFYNYDEDKISIKYGKYCYGIYTNKYIIAAQPVPTMVTD